ncbi:MAG TPA: ABC transporter substrate-binding protein [Jatrophihabitantaceae bacterium]
MHWKRVAELGSAGIALVAVIAACSSSKKTGGGGGGKSGGTSAECAPFSKWTGLSGKKVTMYSSITDPEGQHLRDSWKTFEKCTGITINYQADKAFEAQLKIKVDGGNAPDIALIPQPGLLANFATTNKLKPASAATKTEATANWSADWIKYGTVNGTFYAAPMGSNVKSFIWYSPKAFKDKGYQIPQTWDDLIKLSDKIVADGGKPWCAGAESGDATGWPLTDWMEELMLRMHGPDVYDQWATHKIPFNDPQVADVLAKVGQILKNPKYVNGGIGDVKSIATTAFQKGGLPIETGDCYMHAQASFYAANWDKGTTVGPDGDVFAFYEPTVSDQFGKPVEGGGEFVAAFADRPEVQAVQEYLATADWANSRLLVTKVSGGGWVTGNKNASLDNFGSDVDKLSFQLLTDPKTVFRFDASDTMPSSVGAGSFWKQMTTWITGQSDQTTLNNIEKSWPK